jgi:hypothetical protein
VKEEEEGKLGLEEAGESVESSFSQPLSPPPPPQSSRAAAEVALDGRLSGNKRSRPTRIDGWGQKESAEDERKKRRDGWVVTAVTETSGRGKI